MDELIINGVTHEMPHEITQYLHRRGLIIRFPLGTTEYQINPQSIWTAEAVIVVLTMELPE